MSTIAVKDGPTIYYKDWGKGPVVTFSHGWPLNSNMWDGQIVPRTARLRVVPGYQPASVVDLLVNAPFAE